MRVVKCDLKPFRFCCHNGFFSGFKLKRELTLRESKYILNNLLGIAVEGRDCFEDSEGYKEYNDEIHKIVTSWLRGELEDDAIQSLSYDCSEEPLGVFNALNIVIYLQKHGII